MFLNSPPKTLKAAVEITRRYVEVSNGDSFDWVDCTLTVNPDTAGECAYQAGTIYAGSSVQIPLFEFANPEGHRFDLVRRKVVRFAVRCRNGQYRP